MYIGVLCELATNCYYFNILMLCQSERYNRAHSEKSCPQITRYPFSYLHYSSPSFYQYHHVILKKTNGFICYYLFSVQRIDLVLFIERIMKGLAHRTSVN